MSPSGDFPDPTGGGLCYWRGMGCPIALAGLAAEAGAAGAADIASDAPGEGQDGLDANP